MIFPIFSITIRSSMKKPIKKSRHKKPEVIYELDEANNRMVDAFNHHGLADYPYEKTMQLCRFYRLLMQQQNKENFTRLLKFRDIVIKHFVDCLIVPLEHYQLKFPLIDMGTGPGFPGIPLKIHYPDERIILVEGVKKRVNFLKEVRESLGLKNLDIIGRYVDEDFNFPIQSVITRAVAEITPTLKYTYNCLPEGGEVVFMKGPNVDEELEKAIPLVKGKFYLSDDITYTLPNTNHNRRLVVFKKGNQ